MVVRIELEEQTVIIQTSNLISFISLDTSTGNQPKLNLRHDFNQIQIKFYFTLKIK